MVKNEKGGKKSKMMGRKHLKEKDEGSQQSINVRYAKENGEIYAVVSKIFGGTMCLVECADGVSRNCIIRRKFAGRRKKDNVLTQGVWVLVGERDWEVLTAGKKPRCDLLEVYSAEEKNKLENSSNVDVRRLSKMKFDDNNDNEDSSHDFITSETLLYEKILAENNDDDEDGGGGGGGKKKPTQAFNFDDI